MTISNFNEAVRLIQSKIQSQELTTADIKGMKQSDRKILNSITKKNLTPQQENDVIQLAEKIQNKTFSKYDSESPHKKSNLFERVAKGTKQLFSVKMGGRLSSEEVMSNIKKREYEPTKEKEVAENPLFGENLEDKGLTKEKELERVGTKVLFDAKKLIEKPFNENKYEELKNLIEAHQHDSNYSDIHKFVTDSIKSRKSDKDLTDKEAGEIILFELKLENDYPPPISESKTGSLPKSEIGQKTQKKSWLKGSSLVSEALESKEKRKPSSLHRQPSPGISKEDFAKLAKLDETVLRDDKLTVAKKQAEKIINSDYKKNPNKYEFLNIAIKNNESLSKEYFKFIDDSLHDKLIKLDQTKDKEEYEKISKIITNLSL